MFFWFLGTVVCAVWFVFRDPRFDYRLLLVGAVLPGAVDALFGGARVLHSVTFAVALLAALMLATPGRKPIRKTLLGLPIRSAVSAALINASWIDSPRPSM